MTKPKSKGLSREQAAELYNDLRKALAQAQGGKLPPKAAAKSSSDSSVAKQIAQEISRAMSKDSKQPAGAKPQSERYSFDPSSVVMPKNRGAVAAVGLVLTLGVVRVCMSAMDAFGVFEVSEAQAALAARPVVQQPFSKEEVKILGALDGRRVELAERSKKLDDREKVIEARDREFAVRVAQLKELTDKLKGERDRSDKKRNSQIEQLANVYGSMGPQEAAQLIEQLDVTIALALIEKMPEKKIGQILSMMNKEKALTITKMLSGKVS